MIKRFHDTKKLTAFEAVVEIAKTLNRHFPELTPKQERALRCHTHKGKFIQRRIIISQRGPVLTHVALELKDDSKDFKNQYKKEILTAFELLVIGGTEAKVRATWQEHGGKPMKYPPDEFVMVPSFKNTVLEANYLGRIIQGQKRYGLFLLQKNDVKKYCALLLRRKGPGHRQLNNTDRKKLAAIIDNALEAYRLKFGHAATSITIPAMGKFRDHHAEIVKQLERESKDKKIIAWVNIAPALADIFKERGLKKGRGRTDDDQKRDQSEFLAQFINILVSYQ
jgi:hypothetical protein